MKKIRKLIINEGYWVISVANDVNMYEKKIKYLHQLQHELWDAGIDLNLSIL